MKKIKDTLGELVSDLLLILGGACIALGAGMYSPPAGVIAGGVLLILGTVLAAKGGDDE